MKILVLIFTCQKYKSRIDILEKAGYFDIFEEEHQDYLIVIGNEKNMEEEYILNEKILTVNVDDSYKGLSKKIIKTINILYNLFDYDYIIKSDDDCIININRVLENITYIEKCDYVGCLNNYKSEYNSNYNGLDNTKSTYYGPYMNGANGYMLSKKAIETIVNNKEQTDKLLLNEFYEDKLIGDILRLNGYKFNEHAIWKSKIINFKRLSNCKKLINAYNKYISFANIQ